MKWFKHDSDASSDAKIKKLIIRHGAVGYAVYFHCLELITSDLSESHLTFELEHDSEIISDNLKINGNGKESGMEIVEKIMYTIIELGLFEGGKDKIFCLKLAKRLDSSMTSNPKFRAKIKKSHDRVMIGSCKKRIEYSKEDNILLNKEESFTPTGEDSITMEDLKLLTLKNKYKEYLQCYDKIKNEDPESKELEILQEKMDNIEAEIYKF